MPGEPSPEERRRIADLFRIAFDGHRDIRRFLAGVLDQRALGELVDGGGPADAAFQAVELLARLGVLFDERLVIRLLEERPGRRAQICDVFRSALGERVDGLADRFAPRRPPAELYAEVRGANSVSDTVSLELHINAAWREILVELRLRAGRGRIADFLGRVRVVARTCGAGTADLDAEVARAEHDLVATLCEAIPTWPAEVARTRGGGEGSILIGETTAVFGNFERLLQLSGAGDPETALLPALDVCVRSVLDLETWIRGRLHEFVHQGSARRIIALAQDRLPRTDASDARARLDQVLDEVAAGVAAILIEDLEIRVVLARSCEAEVREWASRYRRAADAALERSGAERRMIALATDANREVERLTASLQRVRLLAGAALGLAALALVVVVSEGLIGGWGLKRLADQQAVISCHASLAACLDRANGDAADQERCATQHPACRP